MCSSSLIKKPAAPLVSLAAATFLHLQISQRWNDWHAALEGAATAQWLGNARASAAEVQASRADAVGLNRRQSACRTSFRCLQPVLEARQLRLEPGGGMSVQLKSRWQ